MRELKKEDKFVLIMAGGIGSRFWPVSKRSLPKQFIDILGVGKTLIQQTYERFLPLVPKENIFIVTNEEYVTLVKEQLPQLNSTQILAEPQARNTAPCIAYASFVIQNLNPNAVCAVAPSDHMITNENEFLSIIEKSFEFVAQFDSLITLGIQPTRPDTGYGYIQYQPIPSGQGFHEVKAFTEKPTLEIAQSFIDSGEFLWNAGIFIWNINAIVHRFEKHLPEIYQIFQEINFTINQPYNAIEKAYGLCPNISIDYGILEKDENVYVYPSNFGWNDLGTWKSLWDVHEKDQFNSVSIGKNILNYNTHNSIVFSTDNKLIITHSIDNLVIVNSENALLILNKDQEQELRNVVNDVKNKFKDKYN